MHALANRVAQFMVEDDPSGAILPRIEAAFAHHAQPAGAWFRFHAAGLSVSDHAFNVFARRFRTGTFAEFTYTEPATAGGSGRSFVFVGSSGRGDPPLGLDVPVVTPVATFRDRHAVVIHAERDPGADTDVTPSPDREHRPGNPHARDFDAEMGIAETVDRFIRRCDIAAGGRLTGFVSQPMCVSCRAALQRLADNHRLEVFVTALAPGSAAYRQFDRARRDYMFAVREHVDRPRGLNRSGTTRHTVERGRPPAVPSPESCE
ncbi:hypothetical protein FIV34_02240 [Luteibacter pinisoli]|uniref:Deaminase n=1 Tax=Luteibacter pinisoli TaxID=2589080 RepID=A0A4Y5Z0Q4_9GAMM|nr:hypothetical protein [Luteibacter pinisoli]QDE38098.1 hypothetical protein FIV34_02240 [Luteibacter pinisoli]